MAFRGKLVVFGGFAVMFRVSPDPREHAL